MNDRELILSGVDVAELMGRFLNNTTLMRMIVGKFTQDQTFAQLKAAVELGDMQAAEFACHSLKGVCGNLSLKKLFVLLQEQLRLFRAGESDAAVAMMPEISELYENTIAHLNLWLEQQ